MSNKQLYELSFKTATDNHGKRTPSKDVLTIKVSFITLFLPAAKLAKLFRQAGYRVYFEREKSK